MTIDPRFAPALSAYGLYGAPPAAGPLSVNSPAADQRNLQAQNANFNPDLTFHGQSSGVGPRELAEAANILQYASTDELRLAYSQGPPELKQLVNQELQRRITSGDPNPKVDPTEAVPAAPVGGGATPPPAASGPAPGTGFDLPTMPSAKLASNPSVLGAMPSAGAPAAGLASVGGALSTLRTPPAPVARIAMPRPGPLSSPFLRKQIVELRPPVTRGAISPLAKVPARRGAPQSGRGSGRTSSPPSESDILNEAELARHRGAIV